MPAVTWLLAWRYASRRFRLIDPRLDAVFVRNLTRQYAISNLLYLTALAVALWSSLASLAICIGLILLYLPPPKPVYH